MISRSLIAVDDPHIRAVGVHGPRGMDDTASPIALVVTNDEPRILDTDLATRLGMKNPRNVRPDLIRPNMAELLGLGKLQETTADTGKRGPKPKVFYLNEEQALLIAMFARTANAADVRREVLAT